MLDPVIYPRTDARIILSCSQKWTIAVCLLAGVVFLLWDYVYFLFALNLVICLLHFVITPLKFGLLLTSVWQNPEIRHLVAPGLLSQPPPVQHLPFVRLFFLHETL